MSKNGKDKVVFKKWLMQMADAEDRCGSFVVAGLLSDLNMLPAQKVDAPRVFGQLIGFARRGCNLSIEDLSAKADVELSELLLIERDEMATLSPRTVFQLANALGLPDAKLMELAGLAVAKDEVLSQAALRFAARSEPTKQLSKEEREAYEEFVKVLVDNSDRS